MDCTDLVGARIPEKLGYRLLRAREPVEGTR
jgi:hypothetical protein